MAATAADRVDLLLRREQLSREQFAARARGGLLNFTKYTKPDYQLNWHHIAVGRLMTYVYYKRTPREYLASYGITGAKLQRMLNQPHEITQLYAGMTRPEMLDEPLANVQVCFSPRAGKTELLSRRLPAWWLGGNPNEQLIATSFASDLAQQNNRDVQRIIDDRAYRELFPNTGLFSSNVRTVARGAYLRNSDIFEVVGHKGFYKAAGVGGQIMGRGATLAIVDDPFKSRKQAESAKERQTIAEWFRGTLYSRLELRGLAPAVQLIVNTRWHQSDLTGVTTKDAREDPGAEQWFCLVFPALLDCEPGPADPRAQGESIWEQKYPLSRLSKIRKTMSSYDWESLHQQRPTSREGAIIKDTWWKFYDLLPEGLTDWLISVDLSFKDRGDPTAMQVWACKGADRFLVDQTLARMTFTDSLRAFRQLCAKYPQARLKLVEEAANGAALIDTLKKEISGIVPVSVSGKGSKELRLDAVSPIIESGNVYLPTPRLASWVKHYIDEFNMFPMGAHDDQIDATSQALIRLSETKRPTGVRAYSSPHAERRLL